MLYVSNFGKSYVVCGSVALFGGHHDQFVDISYSLDKVGRQVVFTKALNKLINEKIQKYNFSIEYNRQYFSFVSLL